MKTNKKVELSQCQGEAWRMSCKLQSLGAVLERQEMEPEGFGELAGMGMILSELSEELGDIARSLDLIAVGAEAQSRV